MLERRIATAGLLGLLLLPTTPGCGTTEGLSIGEQASRPGPAEGLLEPRGELPGEEILRRLRAIDAVFEAPLDFGLVKSAGGRIFLGYRAIGGEGGATVAVRDSIDGEPRVLTARANELPNVEPSPDGSFVAVLESGGGRRGDWRLYPTDGGPAIGAPLEGGIAVAAGKSSLAWRPDGSGLCFATRGGASVALRQLDFNRPENNRELWTAPDDVDALDLSITADGSDALVVALAGQRFRGLWTVGLYGGPAVELTPTLPADVVGLSLVDASGPLAILLLRTAAGPPVLVGIDRRRQGAPPIELLALPADTDAVHFVDGQLIVDRDGTASAPATLDVYTASGAFVRSLPIPAELAIDGLEFTGAGLEFVALHGSRPQLRRPLAADLEGPGPIVDLALGERFDPRHGSRRSEAADGRSIEHLGLRGALADPSAPVLPWSAIAPTRGALLWQALGGVVEVEHSTIDIASGGSTGPTLDDLAARLLELDLIPTAAAAERIAAR